VLLRTALQVVNAAPEAQPDKDDNQQPGSFNKSAYQIGRIVAYSMKLIAVSVVKKDDGDQSARLAAGNDAPGSKG